MINKLKHRGYHVCHKGEDGRYLTILDDILSCNVRRISVPAVFKTASHTHVSLLDTEHGKFVMKIFSPRKKRVERFLKSLFRQNDNENLIQRIDNAEAEGHTFPNNFYLLAERRFLTFTTVSIMLFEYIPGPDLNHLPALTAELQSELKASMQAMHEMGIISGDAHGGNFILSEQGIRAIDLSGKPCNVTRRVEDAVTANIRLGIPFEPTGLWDKWVAERKMKRHLKIRHRKQQYSILNHQPEH